MEAIRFPMSLANSLIVRVSANLAAVHKFKNFCLFSMVNVTVMCEESIMIPKKVICFGIISDLSILSVNQYLHYNLGYKQKTSYST